MTTYNLDVKYLLCPLPVIKLAKKMDTIATNEIIKITTTDRGVLNDIPAWAKIHGHQILTIVQNQNHITIKIKKR